MNERIHKYFYEELSTEERLSLLRDVEASEELKKEFVEYQNLYALLNLGHIGMHSLSKRSFYRRM